MKPFAKVLKRWGQVSISKATNSLNKVVVRALV